jgi:3-oxoacyl-[acyl-carrier-protein] synthase III
MPKLLDRAVSQIKKTGQPTKAAWPIAFASLQRAGDLKKGSVKPTAKGTKRGAMTQKQRRANPP